MLALEIQKMWSLRLTEVEVNKVCTQQTNEERKKAHTRRQQLHEKWTGDEEKKKKTKWDQHKSKLQPLNQQ